MSRVYPLGLWLILFGCGPLWAWCEVSSDSIPMGSVVFLEGRDADGDVLSRGIGVIVRKNFIATNYHYVAGMAEVAVFKRGESREYISDGYLSVEEDRDVIILSVPGVNGQIATLSPGPFPGDGAEVRMLTQPSPQRSKVATGVVSGRKEIREMDLPEVITREVEDFTGGPVFYQGKVAGFCTAGYLDDRYYAYIMPASEARRLMNRSFIIKAFNSLKDLKPLKQSDFQDNLMENLNSVLWLDVEDAERLARKKEKMVVLHVYAKWAGWAKLMDKNTYASKRIIRYINENFYAVRFNAESNDTIVFNNLAYYRNIGSPYHTLAYSLLEGNMEFPSTVFLDEEINLLLVIPGYMDADKMDVVLHYFSEKAYLNEQLSFLDFEQKYRRRRPNY
ncbi:MAG: trypsin-like peptidase domain-containing protein [Bacteroidota bacterium]